jgi:hypothetical protein
MRLNSIDGGAITLYHGTLSKNLKSILKNGLEPSPGWGGAGTHGVYLSGSVEGAKYWAVFAYARDKDEDFEMRKTEPKASKHISILSVVIPPEFLGNLRADMEQAEDVGFEGSAEDWQESLKLIGDAMYVSKIPPDWISRVGM